MAYEIQVNVTEPVITSSSTNFSVTVNSPATNNFTVTNTVNTVDISSNLNTTTIYTDAVELVLANLNNFWRGNWASTSTYTRGDIVDYQYSQYFLKDFNIDPLAVYGPSATPPPDDSTWIRFNWHEAPFSVLTVTNSATFQGPIFANNTALFSNVATFSNTLNNTGNLVSTGQASFTTATFTTATIGTANVTDLFLGGATGNGLVVNSTATFNGRVNLNNTTTVNGSLIFNTSSQMIVANLTVTNELWVAERFVYNGLLYPKDKGLFGQVLYTNGSDKADWVNLGELVFWSLSNDLYTNGFDIYTNSLNENLGIGVSTNNNFTSSPAYAKFNANGIITIAGTGTVSLTGGNAGINLNSINIDTNSRLNVTGSGIRFNDGTVQTTAALNQEINGGANGGIIVSYNTSTGYTITLNNASSTQIGGVRPNNSSFEMASGAVMNLRPATTTTLGGVKIGTGISITDGTINLNTATTANLGGIILGTGLTADANGVVSVTGGTGLVNSIIAGTGIAVNTSTGNITISQTTATLATIGGVKPGDGIGIQPDGTIFVLGGTGTGVTSIIAGTGTNVSTNTGAVVIWTKDIYDRISLSEDMNTNGYDIRYNAAYAYNKIALATDGLTIASSSTNYNANLEFNNDTTVFSYLKDSIGDTGSRFYESSLEFSRGKAILQAGEAENQIYSSISLERTNSNDYFAAIDVPNAALNLSNYSPNYGNATLSSNSTTTLAVGSNSVVAETAAVKIKIGSVDKVTVQQNQTTIATSATIIGSDSSNSTIRVQRIYNYAGTFAPFFPAGVQFQDNSVQFTAYQPDLGLL